jgi:hypothetical protein
VIVGLGGDDTIDGKGGNDKICGGDGNDFLTGGGGNDQIDGGKGVLDIALFADSPGPVSADLQAGTASGDGNDTLAGVEGLVGSAYGDQLAGDKQLNLLAGISGDDTIDGRGGGDIVAFLTATGAVTANLATGSSSGAGEGTDSLSNVSGLAGSAYDDVLTGDGERNVILGRDGNDQLSGAGGNDVLWGGNGNDQVNGGDGLDALYGDPGNDTLDGGSGPYDVVSYALVPGPVDVDLTAGTATGAGSDTLANINSVDGSPAGDTLSGDGGANVISGLTGSDTIAGGAGSDILDGGPGTDSLDGGADTDTCTNGETVSNCEIGNSGVSAATPHLLKTLSSRLAAMSAAPPPAGTPPGAPSQAQSPLLNDDGEVQSATVECWLRFTDRNDYDITIGAPWTPHSLNGEFNEQEWFIPRIFSWDGTSWVPATNDTDGWGQWTYTYPGSVVTIITVPFGGPWFGTNGDPYATNQSWTVPNGYYYRIAGWVEWHNSAGQIEAHEYAWMDRVFGADSSGPWCYGPEP